MPVKKSQLLMVAAAVVATGVAAAGVAAYLYFKRLHETAINPLEMAKVLPDEALMATFISPTPKALMMLQRFGTPEAQKLVGQGLYGLQEQTLAGTQIDFEKDLKPWVGGMAIALLPAQPSSPTDPPKLMIAIAARNKTGAGNFANKLKTQPGATSQETEYKGVKISEIAEQSGKRYSLVLLDDRLVIAPVRKAVEEAIETFQGQPSLATKAEVAQTFSSSTGVPNPLATLFVADYPNFVKQLKGNLPDNLNLPVAVLSQFQRVKSVVLGVGVDGTGLKIRAISQLDSSVTQPPAIQNQLLTEFPNDTIAVMGGRGLGKIWSQATLQTKDNPEIARAVQQVRQGFQRLDLNADRDIFAWMDGEFAIGTIASNQGILSQLGMGGTMIVETSNRAQAEATLKKLDAIARTNQSVSVAPRNVQGKEVTEWKISQQGTLFGHGWLNQNSVFVAFGGPLVDVITSQPEPPLTQSPSFQAISNSLPPSSQGYFYVDVDKLMAWANRYLLAIQPTLLPRPAIELLNSTQGISLTTTQSTPTTAQVDVLLALKSRK